MRGQYRQQLTAWLQGQAELMLFNASDRYREQLEKTEQRWQDGQRRQAELTALSQALMLLIGGVAVIAMLWLTSAGVGGNSQPGALIALFVFCALAAFEALAPVTGAFQHLGQVIASAPADYANHRAAAGSLLCAERGPDLLTRGVDAESGHL
ncbi:cysteine/glutathione ABC transporter membrane /ATP-binding component [Raoultella terrigena]|uniref:Cysteine/glutathione ABC transporter membrane /ATP-binding component n=1 Tax=Raoultella terrigena TaxID=577 RepID=A0A4U9DB08_RAOTE|nr:cysteine/glutathione ABC transporter membrane /ATP-binding component [Raoultella terrigena]